jgi:hypothetical protein
MYSLSGPYPIFIPIIILKVEYLRCQYPFKSYPTHLDNIYIRSQSEEKKIMKINIERVINIQRLERVGLEPPTVPDPIEPS